MTQRNDGGERVELLPALEVNIATPMHPSVETMRAYLLSLPDTTLAALGLRRIPPQAPAEPREGERHWSEGHWESAVRRLEAKGVNVDKLLRIAGENIEALGIGPPASPPPNPHLAPDRVEKLRQATQATLDDIPQRGSKGER